MGNLGRYQEIVELAKQSGGVDKMLQQIQRAAVSQAAPKLVLVGAGLGATILAVGRPAASWAKNKWNDRRSTLSQGAQAAQGIEDIIQSLKDTDLEEVHKPDSDASDADAELNNPISASAKKTAGEDDANRS